MHRGVDVSTCDNAQDIGKFRSVMGECGGKSCARAEFRDDPKFRIEQPTCIAKLL